MSGQVFDSPGNPTTPTDRSHPPSDQHADKPIPHDTTMTAAARNGGAEDDEEEEGMLKVDEEGQIEEDQGAVHQVSQSRPTTDARAIPLADRLMPLLPDVSLKLKPSNAPSSSTSNGYVSPRHAPSDRERDRDRNLETSPGPSSLYAPQRSRFGYAAESPYPYPANHREPLRSEPYASGSRTSFSGGPTSRTDARRGWYPPPPTTAAPRGSDTYRPGANRERERERDRDRDWESFRDGDRDRDWAALDRERERDGYRHSAYPPSANSKYGFDNREFAARRPASPSAALGRDRDRDFDTDRSRDRDRPTERDPRVRASSSGWSSGGMRQWGKPSDGGWESRSARRPASDDARSDTSQRQSGSRSNNTPPPAGSSEAGVKLAGSDRASEKSEARSRDLSPHPTRSPPRELHNEKEAEPEAAPSGEAKEAAQSVGGTVADAPSASADVQDEKKDDEVQKDAESGAPTTAEVSHAEPDSQTDVQTQPVPIDAQVPSTSNDVEAQQSTDAPSRDDTEATATEPAPSNTDDVPSAPAAEPASNLPDDPMQVEADEPAQIAPQTEKQSEEVPPQEPTAIASDVVKSEATEAPSLDVEAAVVDKPAALALDEPVADAGGEPLVDSIESTEDAAAKDEAPAEPALEQTKEAIDDVDMPDVEPQPEPEKAELAQQEPAAAPDAPTEAGAEPESREAVNVNEIAEPAQPAADNEAAVIAESQPTEEKVEITAVDSEDAMQAQEQASAAQTQPDEASTVAPDASIAPPLAVEADAPVEVAPAGRDEIAAEAEPIAASEPSTQPEEATVKVEEEQAPQISDVSMTEAPAEDTVVEQDTKNETQMEESAPAAEAEKAAEVEAAPITVTAAEPQPIEAEAESLPPTSTQIQVSGQFVTATIDTENKTQEITLPHVDYGDGKQAQALVQQETAKIEEVEMPAADQAEPSLRIAEIDEAAAKEIEPPLVTPSTQEQIDRAIQKAVRQHIATDLAHKDDWKKILRENQLVSQRTTMDVLKAKIHGIPQIVSSDQPLWLEDDDKQAKRTQAHLFTQLLDRKKRLNEKAEELKKRYRSINDEWKLHCQRLDRSAERREMLRRPQVNTPAGTPGGFGVEDAPSGGGGGGGGLLGASLTTGRANRRSAQAGGFAGFGDAVRSEAEFLEILASLENADMQDPNMRAARTTATAPDMYINPDSDRLMKLRYDDVNGFVADPLAFYLDEFDPDVWSEEEKAIFARRYALWPKQFGKIAQALPHKTPAQCVRYYYLNKKVPGNDFKALAAARNRERKRKARVKPKKAKGSALMADLKSAKGEEVDDVEDGSGMRSPVEAVDPSAATANTPMSSNGRRGGRSRMVPPAADGVPGAGAEDGTVSRKRQADQGDLEAKGADAKTSDKRKSGSKSKRAKSDGTSATDKSRKSRPSAKKDNATPDEAKASVPPSDAAALPGAKVEASEPTSLTGVAGSAAASAEVKTRMEDSDLAAAEALGALAGLFGGPAPADASTNAATADAAASQQPPGDVDADGRKVGKKRRSKTAAPGEEGGEVSGGKGRGKQPTSSYWSVAERYEFLRALAVHGPRWEIVSSTLAQKSTAQARNYFARNEDEIEFAEAAALARSHADAPLEEREKLALAFVRQRFANNSAPGVLHVPSVGPGGIPASVAATLGLTGDAGAKPSRATHLPPPPGISAGPVDTMDVKMREESPEPLVHRRGLQINSLLNDTDDAASSRVARRSSLHDWQAERGDAPMGRDTSVPPSLYARQPHDLERRPVTADRLEAVRPLSSDGRTMRDEHEERARAYDRLDPHRSAVDGRDARDESVEARPWMYESPYEAHRRPSPSPGYAAMAPPSHPAERGMPASRYSMPPSSVLSSGHIARSVPPMSGHLASSEDAEVERERERERAPAGYGLYGASGRAREHESHSMPPAAPGELRRSGSGEQISPTSAQFGASHGYSRYAAPSVGSLYPSTTAVASSALASRSRASNGPLTAPLPSTSERATYEQRWQRYSQSPGPSISSSSTSASAGGGATHASTAYSAGSAYRSSNSPYSSFPSQSLPRPSLPSLGAGGGKVGAPHLPSLGAAGRSLPPILGTFPAPGRSGMPGARTAGASGEEPAARYWPYPHRPRGHEQPPSGRNPE
ncbi:conserved hypothetical protein [Sporisorium reilianum SRZ2]|uniref:SANT domain-containing protein n=1 Tax=Sporisorium reilianum (strain SRZ2) TaxID=999809 RepID=E6ZT25_SPORE|nr:conserved hypothetical protein [Sporisorium reilianum SRZ2]